MTINKIIFGDNRDILRQIDDNSVDLIYLELTATGQSDAGIEFYSWDCSYDSKKGFKPSLIIDKEGRYRYQFKAGQHLVAVKVVDNDGLESIEVIKLQVNGKIKRTNIQEQYSNS
jgi:hypothetical protein